MLSLRRPRRGAALAVLPPVLLLLLALVAGAASPSGAAAAASMRTGLADDGVLNRPLAEAEPIVARWKAAGVQDVRLFAQWSHIAPAPEATRMPTGFDDRADGAYDLRRLDEKIDLVRRHGMSVTLTITGPGPIWGSLEPARRNPRWRPDPARFGRFATAVATHVASRVDRYVIWNEPNIATWLQPQQRCTGTRCRPYAPHLYRKLADAGYRAIRKADPRATIAIGATSSKGDQYANRTNSTTQPLRFLREMACVSPSYRRQTTGDCRGFVRPRGNVLAYHPHSSTYSPGYRSPSGGDARMGDLSRLTTVVDRLTRGHRIAVVGAKRLPLWLSEYAYETNPPDKRMGISPAKQAAWSQWGWWTAARNPRVQLLTHYEWQDEPIAAGDHFAHGWQSGLYYADGRAKPLAAAFPNPIFGYRTARRATVWGQVRTATGRTRIELQRRAGQRWRRYRTITSDRRGAFSVRVPRSSSARYRYRYVSAIDGRTRTSAVTALRKR